MSIHETLENAEMNGDEAWFHYHAIRPVTSEQKKGGVFGRKEQSPQDEEWSKPYHVRRPVKMISRDRYGAELQCVHCFELSYVGGKNQYLVGTTDGRDNRFICCQDCLDEEYGKHGPTHVSIINGAFKFTDDIIQKWKDVNGHAQ